MLNPRIYAERCLRDEAEAVLALIPQLDESFDQVVDLIFKTKGHVVISVGNVVKLLTFTANFSMIETYTIIVRAENPLQGITYGGGTYPVNTVIFCANRNAT